MERMPDDGFAIGHNAILLPFIHEPHHNPIFTLSTIYPAI
jgi:hypothetical protein